MITLENGILTVKTATQTAIFSNGALISLKDSEGRSYIENSPEAEALYLVFRYGEKIGLKNTGFGKVSSRIISDNKAEFFFDAWDGNGVIEITADNETGDILIEPEVTSARHGVLAARFGVGGIDKRLSLVAPFYQGINMRLDDELLSSRKWHWPMMWEAGLVILNDNSDGCGFWIWTEDNRYRAKSVLTGQGESKAELAFDAEAYGPIDRNLSAGGLCWRINVYKGGWKTPAARYRDWLWKAYNLKKEEEKRFPWTKDIKLGVSWCPSNAEFIDELAKKVEPKKILLHLPHWRVHKYDQNYPDYTPSEDFKRFIEYSVSKGFRCMPHANSVDMDPSMPEYRYLQDYKYREIERGTFMGWGYHNGRVLGVPSSNFALDTNRDKNVMIKVHPGLALWRSILARRIDEALEQLNYITDTVFIDVTLCSYNLENCLVDNTTSMEGMKRLIAAVESIRGGLAVGGEGLNEITMQNLTFAQAHLFDSHQATRKGLERCGGNDLNDFMFGRLVSTIGYSGLGGGSEDSALRMRIHEEHGAIPTITCSDPEQIKNPNPEFKRIFELANS